MVRFHSSLPTKMHTASSLYSHKVANEKCILKILRVSRVWSIRPVLGTGNRRFKSCLGDHLWRDGRNGIIAPILKIGTGDEPVVGSYPALSAKDAKLQSYLGNIIDWKSMRCVVVPLLKVVQVHQMDMRLVFFGVCVRRLGHLPVTEDRGVRFSYTPPLRCKQQ